MLSVIGHKKNRLECEVVHPGTLKQRKGVNIPGLKLQSNIFTEKDRRDINFGIENNFDYVAQSFVRNKKDIAHVAKVLQSRRRKCKIIAKIENSEGLKNIDSIIGESDGIMIARGDLGVSMPIYQIPILQKCIIHHCNKRKKFAVTATQMLESMVHHRRPTRAEVTDIANAIFDGTQYVMLSAETAAGSYPYLSVKMMRQVIDYTENSTLFKKRKH